MTTITSRLCQLVLAFVRFCFYPCRVVFSAFGGTARKSGTREAQTRSSHHDTSPSHHQQQHWSARSLWGTHHHDAEPTAPSKSTFHHTILNQSDNFEQRDHIIHVEIMKQQQARRRPREANQQRTPRVA